MDSNTFSAGYIHTTRDKRVHGTFLSSSADVTIYTIFITKVILTNRVVGDTKHGRSLHTFSLDIRIHGLNQEYNQTEKVKAHLAAR